jgi:hypothetical protein
MPAANGDRVITPNLDLSTTTQNFWNRVLSNNSLREYENLEKLLVGCELIAVLDDLDLLAA